jgi:hypothetical protein
LNDLRKHIKEKKIRSSYFWCARPRARPGVSSKARKEPPRRATMGRIESRETPQTWYWRGPGLRGSNPAKIDHFLLFCELQTCEAIASDGVCSLYLKMGWLCSEGPSEQSHVSEKVQTGMSLE